MLPKRPLRDPASSHKSVSFALACCRRVSFVVRRAIAPRVERGSKMGMLDWLFRKGKSTEKLVGKECMYLFVLGGGFEPGQEAQALCSQFARSNPQADFSKSEIHTASIGRWSDKSRIGTAVVVHLQMWFMMHGMQFNGERILYNDYYDDAEGKGYVVVGYFF